MVNVPFNDPDDVPLTGLEMESPNEDLPLPEISRPRPVLPTQVENFQRVQASVLKVDLEGGDIINAFADLEASGEDPRGDVGRYTAMRVERSRMELKDYVEQVLGRPDTPDGVVATVDTWTEMDTELATTKSSPERQVLEAILPPLSPEEFEIAQLEAELMAVNTLTTAVNNYGTLEKAFDIAKMFLPTTAIDNTQLSGAPLGAEAYASEMVRGLKDMKRNDPVKFQKVYPEIEKELREILPTNKVISVLASVLDPRGEEELSEFSNIDALLDIADLSTLGAGLALSAARLTKRMNVVRNAVRLNNKELATQINTAAVLDNTGEVATKAGLDPETAYNNAAGFVVSELDEGYTAGLAADVIERIQQTKLRQTQAAEDVLSGRTFVREGLVTDEERLAIEADWVNNLKSQGVTDVNVTNRDLTSTTFEYKVKRTLGDEAEGATDVEETVTQRMDLTLDKQTGFWKHTERSMMANWLTSPTVFAKFAKPEVEAAIRMDSSSAVVANTFSRLQQEALKPILGTTGVKNFSPVVRQRLAEVDEVLLAGDQFTDQLGNKGKVYTVEELRGGVVNGVRLNDAQIETYFNVRNLYDELHHIRNVATRRHLVAQGFQEVRLRGDTPAIGRVHSKEGAVGVVNTQGRVTVYDEVEDAAVTISGDMLDDVYTNQNKVLAKLQQPVEKGEIGKFDLVLVDKNKVGDLPEQVLNYRPGYVPKTDKASRWFVKEMRDETVNGKLVRNASVSTVRKFATKAEADRWIKTQKNTNLVVLPDRGLEQQITGSSQLGSGAGLYTGARAAEDIPYGFDGLPAERLNTYESLVNNLQNLERLVTRDQWRMGMQQKWVNSAKAAGFDIDVYEPALIPDTDPRGVGLRRMAEQIDIWSGFPSRSELKWDGLVTSAMEWMTRKWPESANAVAKVGVAARDTNPISFVRSTTFRLLLGMFSPVQLWVQAQGAALAFSLHPLRAARAVPIQMAMSAAQLLGKDSRLGKSTLAKLAGLSTDEFTALETAWKRTGYKDSLYNIADYSAASRGASVIGDQLGRMADKTAIFYRMGESVNRRLSFTISALNMRAQKGSFKFTDAELKRVMSDANHMMLDLSNANAAQFQRGLVSIPTQFFQVQTKFMETLLGLNDNFTKAERLKIILGQVGLYGAAGVPLGGLGVRVLAEKAGLNQQDIDDMPPELVESINQGMWGLVFNSYLGADIDVAGRGAIAEGMVDTVLEAISSDSSVGEVIVGASGALPQRFFKAWSEIKPMVLNGGETPITKEEVIESASTIAQVMSSWNNFQKGYFMMRMQRVVDGRGNPIVNNKDLTMTAYMQMIGFQPKDVATTFELERLVRGRDEYQAGVADALIQHYWNYVTILYDVESPAKREAIMRNYEAGTRTLMSSLSNDGERASVKQRVRNRLINPQTRQERAIRKYIETFSDGRVVDMTNMLDAARTTGLIQLQPSKQREAE